MFREAKKRDRHMGFGFLGYYGFNFVETLFGHWNFFFFLGFYGFDFFGA